MSALRCILLFYLICYSATSESCTDKDKCEEEECEIEDECRPFNCQNLSGINTSAAFAKFYEKCNDESIVRFRFGEELLIHKDYVAQSHLDNIFDNYLSICLRIYDPVCSLNLQLNASIEHSCAMDIFNPQYDTPTLLWIERADCSLAITADTSPNRIALPIVTPLPEAILTDGTLPTFSGNYTKTEYAIVKNFTTWKQLKDISSRVIYGDVIITEDFPYNVEIEGLTIHGCFKVINATNARDMEHFLGINLHDHSLCHGDRAIEFIGNENMCIPDKAFYSMRDNGAEHNAYISKPGKAVLPVSLSRYNAYRRGDCDETCGEYGVTFRTSRFDIIKKTMRNRTCRYFEGNLKINTDTVTGLETVEEVYGSLTFANAINIRHAFPMLRGIEDHGKQRYKHPALKWAIEKAKPCTRKSLPEFSFQLTRFAFVMIKNRESVQWSSSRGGIENSQIVAFAGMDTAGISYVDNYHKDREKTSELYKSGFAEFTKDMFIKFEESFKKTFRDELWFKISVEASAILLCLLVFHLLLRFSVPVRKHYKMPVPPPDPVLETELIANCQKLANKILMEPAADVVKRVRQYLIENRKNIDNWNLENRQDSDLHDEEESMEVGSKK